MKVRWHRSREGFVTSYCKRWDISPEYWGQTSPRNYVLKNRETKESLRFDTQKECKEYAEDAS